VLLFSVKSSFLFRLLFLVIVAVTGASWKFTMTNCVVAVAVVVVMKQ